MSSAQVVHRTHGPDAAPVVAPTAQAAAAASAVDWCANTDPAANQYSNGDYRYHAVYAHPRTGRAASRRSAPSSSSTPSAPRP